MTGVLVTGGTGKTGRALVGLLRAGEVPARVASRNPAAGDPEAVRFDWNDPATFTDALRGTDRVFLVPPVESVDPMPLVRPFLEQARAVGVRRVVLLGSAIVLPNAPSALDMADYVRALPGGVVLRASGFMQNFLRPHPIGESISSLRTISTAAGDGRVGWIDARDIALSAAALLTAADDRRSVDDDYLLTGPKALSYQEAADIISAQTEQHVRVDKITTEQQIAAYRAAGMPAEFASAVASVEEGIRAGREDRVSTAVLDLTGRPPRSFAEFAQDHGPDWQ
ncbi:NAD(P)H-binding protein [Streptomyces sp. NPDC058377]|uniref:NAD(P)H-binding protein n=1 Tax=Streptomyces sp. NPDC058377 TaxID=3346468 RepID=UPI00364BA3A2